MIFIRCVLNKRRSKSLNVSELSTSVGDLTLFGEVKGQERNIR